MKLTDIIYTYIKMGILLTMLLTKPLLDAGSDNLKTVATNGIGQGAALEHAQKSKPPGDAQLVAFIRGLEARKSDSAGASTENEVSRCREYFGRQVQLRHDEDMRFITCLTLSNCKIENIWEVLYQSLKTLKALKELYLDENPSEEWRDVDLNAMMRGDLIKRAKVGESFLFDSESAGTLLGWIMEAVGSSNPNTKKKELEKRELHQDRSRELEQNVQAAVDIHKDEDLASYCELITAELENPQCSLQVLSLSGCKLGGNVTYLLFGYSNLPALRKPNRSLRVINLSGNQIRSLHVSGLKNASRLYESLTELDMSQNAMDGEATKYIDSVALHPKLKVIKLAHNHMDGASARSLFFAACMNKNLEEIDLSNNPIKMNLELAICDAFTDPSLHLPKRILLRNAQMESDSIEDILRAAMQSETNRLELLDLRDDTLTIAWDKVGKILNADLFGWTMDESFKNKGGNTFRLLLGSTKSNAGI